MKTSTRHSHRFVAAFSLLGALLIAACGSSAPSNRHSNSAPTSSTGSPPSVPVQSPSPAAGGKLLGIDLGLAFERSANGFPDDNEVRSRLQVVAPYTQWVRTYNCKDGLASAGRFAHELGLKAAIGASMTANAAATDGELNCLAAAMQRHEVDVAVVANEVIANNQVSESDVLAAIARVRQQAPGVPVTEAEPYATLVAHPELMRAEDVVFANVYPYLHGVRVQLAVAQLAKWYQELVALSGGKQVWISETGWPSEGGGRAGANQKGAVPTEQATAVASSMNACQYLTDVSAWSRQAAIPVFYFAAFDAPNKADKAGTDTAHYGLFDDANVIKPCVAAAIAGNLATPNPPDPALAPLP